MRLSVASAASLRHQRPVAADGALDQPFVRQPVEAALLAVARRGGEHQRQDRAALAVSRKRCSSAAISASGVPMPTKPEQRDGVAVADQRDRLVGGDDLVAESWRLLAPGWRDARGCDGAGRARASSRKSRTIAICRRPSAPAHDRSRRTRPPATRPARRGGAAPLHLVAPWPPRAGRSLAAQDQHRAGDRFPHGPEHDVEQDRHRELHRDAPDRSGSEGRPSVGTALCCARCRHCASRQRAERRMDSRRCASSSSSEAKRQSWRR